MYSKHTVSFCCLMVVAKPSLSLVTWVRLRTTSSFFTVRAKEKSANTRSDNRGQGWAMGIRSFQKNAMFLRSFPFFIKECSVLCVLYKRMRRPLHSFLFFIKERNALCVLYKWTERSLHSFTFFIKERCVLCILLCSL